MAEIKNNIRKALVKLRDASGSFTDPTQDNGSVSGDKIHEVEMTGFIAMGIQGRALIQLSELEEKAYYEEKEKAEIALIQEISSETSIEDAVSEEPKKEEKKPFQKAKK